MENEMTVQDLINLLMKVENKTQVVRLAIHQSNKHYPIAYLKPLNVDYLQQAWNEVRILAWLPDGMFTATRSK
jgi:hypothetical protein